MPDCVFRSHRVATPEGVRPASIYVAGGRIADVGQHDQIGSGVPVFDAGDAVIFPGLVDTHVHVNEPGRTEWEGFASATRAAAAGGVATLLDMPLNSIPPTTTVAALELKRAAARGQAAVDVGFIGGVVPGNAGDLLDLNEAGVRAFKCFLVPSGTSEFPPVGEADLRIALPILADLGALLMVHAELPGPIDRASSAARGNPRDHAAWIASRPVEAEHEAIELLAALALEYRARIHVVHLASAGSIPILAAARRRGAALTAEVCPHYLTFDGESVPLGATEYKCAPPIRGLENREGLWQALEGGDLTGVVTDHSPCPTALKHQDSGDFLEAWGGIASLQLGLAATWTGARARGIPFERLAEWMCAGPARLVGLDRSKGTIAPGKDADLVVWQPEEEFVVTPHQLRHRHSLTPYLGCRLAGVVEATFLRGKAVFRRGAADLPLRGQLI
jgi:allantoinase